ncbi:acetate--CoA ligase family protein [Bradyrhizobium sp. 33ap4]|uniref:acetate--CoA ligase family protein n=1 Tax=Bradyrhizobium sp. 33ap4 TaxID=3061630 RepID=UPI002930C7FA|nr:acetate--CoA ligase family protein [Bradyrhizobium sp. 33ap4]
MKESKTASLTDLAPLFRPKSIAVVGASPTSGWGRQVLEGYRALGYEGKVAVVNPKYKEVASYPCFPSLRSMPFVPDAVLILRDRAATVSVIEEAAEVGVRAAVAPAIGFAEWGAEGAAAQARIADVARTSGMAVVGPNTSGLINWVDRLHLKIGTAEVRRPGHVALFGHGTGANISIAGNKRGVRLSHMVSCGNEAVTGSSDFLRYFIDDPHVKVICGFIETIRDPERFFFECNRARAAGKPVILMKAGRTEAGQKAVAAHTAALAGPYRLYRELFKRHGVVLVDSFEELLACALVLQAGRTPGEGRLGLTSTSGALAEVIMDELGKYPSLSHPDFQPQTVDALRSLLPDNLPVNNPLDFWGTSTQDLDVYTPKVFQAVANDPNIDVVVTPYDPNQTGSTGQEYELFANSVAKAAAATDKLFALVTPLEGSASPEKVEQLLEKNVVVLGMQQLFRALDHAVAWARPVPPIAEQPPINKSELAKRLSDSRGKPFGGKPALDFLAAAGIPVVGSRFVTTVEAAISAAGELGYPVIAKIGDTDVLHRTERSGVITNLRDPQELSVAAKKLFAADSKTLIIQPFVRDGMEMILGLETNDLLGTFVLVGQGGIWTEIMDDAALRPVRLRVGEPEQMIAQLRAEKLLRGVRGAPPLDVQALVSAVRQLDALGHSLGDQIRSLDINPIFVREHGIVAVDALVVPVSSETDG